MEYLLGGRLDGGGDDDGCDGHHHMVIAAHVMMESIAREYYVAGRLPFTIITPAPSDGAVFFLQL